MIIIHHMGCFGEFCLCCGDLRVLLEKCLGREGDFYLGKGVGRGRSEGER